MIASFKSKPLERFWERSDRRRLPERHVKKIKLVLDQLNASVRPRDMDLPGFDFHQLGGDRRGTFTVTITGNWRITFRWSDEDAIDVNYEDYH
jgi:proteic killer suppression protein